MIEVKDGIPQGDMIVRRVERVPEGYILDEGPEADILAHSETGHHHRAVGDFERYTKPDDGLLSYLVMKGDSVDVVHERSFDTHEPIRLKGAPEVVWEIRRQREYTPEGWRRVED